MVPESYTVMLASDGADSDFLTNTDNEFDFSKFPTIDAATQAGNSAVMNSNGRWQSFKVICELGYAVTGWITPEKDQTMATQTVRKDELGHDIPAGATPLDQDVVNQYVELYRAMRDAGDDEAAYDIAEAAMIAIDKTLKRPSMDAHKSAALAIVNDPEPDQTIVQAFTPPAGTTKRELNAYAYTVAGLLSDAPRSVLRVRPGSRKDGTSARYEVEINGYNVTHGYVLPSDARAAIIRHYHEHTSQPDPEPTPPSTPAKKKTTNRATSQKRANQRAARDMQREQYRNSAESGADTVTALIADMGFTVAEQRESGDTPVTIWRDADGLATIKQTPYTIRLYNGQPKRLSKSAADVSFTLTVEYGWQQSGTGTGAAHAFASLIAANIQYDESAGGYGYIDTGEQSPEPASVDVFNMRTQTHTLYTGITPEEAVIAAHAQSLNDHNTWDYATRYGHMVQRSERAVYCGDCGAYLEPFHPVGSLLTVTADGTIEPVTVSHNGPWQAPSPLGQCDKRCGRPATHMTSSLVLGSIARALCDDCDPTTQPDPWNADYTIATTAGTIIAQVSHHDISDRQYPAISGGSHDHTPEPVEPQGFEETGYEDCIINHTPEDGTTIDGNTRPYKDIIKAHGFKWSRTIAAWYLPNSRDKRPNPARINPAGEALIAAGARVTMNLDLRTPDTATVEANRAERLADRQDALTAKAERKSAESDAAHAKVKAISDNIPFGQPILVGHHSEARARKDQDRIHNGMSKTVTAWRESEDAASRAESSRKAQEKRLTAPATMRRIEKLETERRDLMRRQERGQVNTIGGATIAELIAENAEQITYWKDHLATLQESGVKVWTAADFAKGDMILSRFGLCRVERVNKKSVSVTTFYTFDRGLPRKGTITYDDIKNKATAEQAARFFAETLNA